jgi:mannose-6-phosphate isomerase-like protein (cupin superfamily)
MTSMRVHLIAATALGAVVAFGGGRPSAESAATYLLRADWAQTLMTKQKAVPAPDLVDAPVGKGEKYQANVVRRTKPQGAIAHMAGTEIHSILEGSATLVTGGTIVRPASGERGGATIKDGQTWHLTRGDVILVPPQTPHWYKDIEGSVTYLETRFDVGAAPGGPAVALMNAEANKKLGERGAAPGAPLMFSTPVTSGDHYQSNIVRRTKAQGSAAHPGWTEIHHILSGSGTFVTGGTVVRGTTNGVEGNTIDGGVSRPVSAGDVVLVPAGMPHWYKAVDAGGITYVETRFELP